MSIDSFLARHGASAAPRPRRTAADKVLAEIAVQAVLSPDAEQLLRVVDYSIRNDTESLCIHLEKNAVATSPVSIAARRLFNIGILSSVGTTGGVAPTLHAMVSRRTSEVVRDQFTWLMQQGRWLEFGTAELAREVAETSGHQVEVETQVLITLADATLREVDVFVCDGREALLIECKSGHLGIDGIGPYSEMAGALGVDRSHTLVFAPTLGKEALSDLKAFYPITIVLREHLRHIIGQRVDTMATGVDEEKAELAPRSTPKKVEPQLKPAAKKSAPKKTAAKPKSAAKKAPAKKGVSKPKPAATKAPPKKGVAKPKPAAKTTLAKKAAASPQRKNVAPEVIEAALIAAAVAAKTPENLGGLANTVRDQLWSTKTAAQTAAQKLLDAQVFLDKHNEVVRDFSTHIFSVRATKPNSTHPE